MRPLALLLLVALSVAACATVDTASLPRVGVEFAFEARHKCQGVSPAIRLTSVPAGAARYEVRMTDLDVPTFHHWAQTLPASGATIAEGAGRGYFGPCPPSGTHRYQIEVTVKDGAGRAIGHGAKTVTAGR